MRNEVLFEGPISLSAYCLLIPLATSRFDIFCAQYFQTWCTVPGILLLLLNVLSMWNEEEGIWMGLVPVLTIRNNLA